MIVRTSDRGCWAQLQRAKLGHVVWIENDAKNHGSEAAWYCGFWLMEGGKRILKVLTHHQYTVGTRRGRRPHIIESMPKALQRRVRG